MVVYYLLYYFSRQKVDNIMPTLPGAEQGVRSARKFLSERLVNPRLSSKDSRKDSNVSLVSSTITQIGKLRLWQCIIRKRYFNNTLIQWYSGYLYYNRL